ncbi:MAG TPA: hypothetical protein VNZ49_10690 [Bacteroidia bacterium]|jgi:hypothetical protein|nr:hypothetical protein [Bacteroidia bacterium]
MKPTITILFFVFITAVSKGQTDKNLIKENWKPGKEKIIYGHPVWRIEGKNDKRGITNIACQSNGTADTIHFYLTRLTLHGANTDLFTIVVKDSTNKEVLRKELENDIPEAPLNGSDYWSNYIRFPLAKKIPGKIYIYVIEKAEEKNVEFKFEVKL